jgi:hypothetical protein
MRRLQAAQLPEIQTWLAATDTKYALGSLPLLKMFHVLSKTRRRNKYYALMGIATEMAVDEPELRPEYISPIGTVIAQAGRFLWKQGHGVESLLAGGLVQGSGEADVPSWVLDFAGTTGHFGLFQQTLVTDKAAGDTCFMSL